MATAGWFGYHSAMAQPHPPRAIARWGTFLAAILIIGPVIGMVADRIPPIPGARDGTALVSAAPALGLGLVAMCIVLATAIGCIGSRLISVSHGLTCAGLALAWAVFHTGRLLDLSRAVDPGSLGPRLAIEGAIVGVLVLVGTLLIIRVGPKNTPSLTEGLFSPASLGAAAAATAIGMFVAFIIARDDKAGQAFAAAVAGGAVGAAVARTLVNNAPRASALLAIPLGAAACPLVGFALSPKPVDVAIVGGTVHALARIMPLDWCAGALIGIPFGITWAGSMIEKTHPNPKASGQGPSPVRSAS